MNGKDPTQLTFHPSESHEICSEEKFLKVEKRKEDIKSMEK